MGLESSLLITESMLSAWIVQSPPCPTAMA